ncbi:MAG: gephyrin-like molybdotransferase Glp [Vicinamibacterales bacterium]
MTGTRMRPFGRTIPLEDARVIIDAAIQPITRTVRVPLDSALGRVLASPIIAQADVPPFSRAGMDGYAVQAGDTVGATRASARTLDCIGQIFTGDAPAFAIGPGQCVEIATGAPMPVGADAVVMVEETFRAGQAVQIFSAVTASQNVGRQGADIRSGQTVLLDGDLLNPSRIGAAAALGVAEVTVYDAPRVTILSTGNEIIEPGQPLGPGQIYDINRFSLSALVTDNGGVPIARRTARDTIEDLERAVDECQADDLILFSGGSSVGERDLILDVLQKRGTMLFHGLAVKPGKPTAFGRLGTTTFFGLPGYPTSCLSNAYIFVAPALRKLARLPPRRERTVTLPLASRVVSATGRHQFLTVRIVDGLAVPAFKGSGDITSMSQADGYIEIPLDVESVDAGTRVEVTLFV